MDIFLKFIYCFKLFVLIISAETNALSTTITSSSGESKKMELEGERICRV